MLTDDSKAWSKQGEKGVSFSYRRYIVHGRRALSPIPKDRARTKMEKNNKNKLKRFRDTEEEKG